MKVLIMFHIDDEVVAEIMSQDLHAEEILDGINNAAVVNDEALEVWHFPDGSQADIVRAVNDLWHNKSENVPTLGVIRRV